jgi:16S rRNA (guanine966-N2)-methyltransferase
VGKGDAGKHLRPTTDRVRESLFSMLTSRLGGFDELIVLDLFAGTGALGLEAISRGAVQATFVETGRKSQSLIRQNIELTRTGPRTQMLKQDATRLGPNPGAPADLVFLDPPYGKGMGEKALKAARDQNWLAEDALIVWEESAPQEAPEGFTLLQTRSFGDTHVTLLSHP